VVSSASIQRPIFAKTLTSKMTQQHVTPQKKVTSLGDEATRVNVSFIA
jgi:hypothetical protein